MKRKREGFTLIETMVAMTMFAVVMLGMAQMSAAVAVKGRTNSVVAQRNAVLAREANKLGAAPFSSLANWPTGRKVITEGNFTYSRRITITAVSPTRYTVVVKVSPWADRSKRDSVIIERAQPPSSSPLCVGC